MSTDEERWIAQLRKGILELCMLALLANEERYGYQIAQGLTDSAGLSVHEGTIYPLLSRLQREGSVEAQWRESPAGPPRKYYHLTTTGRHLFEAQASSWKAIAQAVDILLEESDNGKSAE
jgi:PadR family transcriptional regulator PadR